MKTPTRPRRCAAALLVAATALVAAASVGTAGAQATEPIVFTVSPPSQTTTPGTQVDLTFTVSDVPPCADANITTLDSFDFTLTEPSGLATIDSFTISEPAGTYSENFSPDMKALTILFDSAFPCQNPSGAPPAVTETITAVVTIDVPGGVPPGTQLSLAGDARGFAQDAQTSGDYQLRRTGTVLVTAPPPPATIAVSPPLQLTGPGSLVDITFTVSDVPPCADENLTTLDSLDFMLDDPTNSSVIDDFTTSEPAGSVSSVVSPDQRGLTLLFDSAFPCNDGATEVITAVVTIDVPASVPLATLLSLEGVARGFASPPDNDYTIDATGFVVVGELPPGTPPPPPPPPDGDAGSDGGAGSADGAAGSAVAATPVSATPRFAG
jgi:hypothetical protein